MTDIVLCTINARWTHASLGLRYLMANLGPWATRAHIEEFTLATPVPVMLDRLCAHQPRVLGLGVYIWNVAQSIALIQAVRQAMPGVRIVLGGPEVSHETDRQEIVRLADHVITGAGELALPRLIDALLNGPRPLMKVIAGQTPELNEVQLPYALYTESDLQHRHLYFEASRGCPYKCAFCLSALDRTAVPFELDRVLAALQDLIARGARRIRFVDRTFNLKTSTSLAILNGLLTHNRAHPEDPVFAHFELVPDHLPPALREVIAAFGPGTLQFEIGIQSWNPEVQALIARRQDNARAEANLLWLREHSQAHLHVDLIAGLPGEHWDSFAAGFDRLFRLSPHEIQVGVLKRLRGTPITSLSDAHGLCFDPDPPYAVQCTAVLNPLQVQRLSRFAQNWERYANSGRFPASLQAWLGPPGGGSAFERFMAFSDHLEATGRAAHHASLESLADWLATWLHEGAGFTPAQAQAWVALDYQRSGARGRLSFMSKGLSGAPPVAAAPVLPGVKGLAPDLEPISDRVAPTVP
jgi:hypothetical protein